MPRNRHTSQYVLRRKRAFYMACSAVSARSVGKSASSGSRNDGGSKDSANLRHRKRGGVCSGFEQLARRGQTIERLITLHQISTWHDISKLFDWTRLPKTIQWCISDARLAIRSKHITDRLVSKIFGQDRTCKIAIGFFSFDALI